MKDKEIVWRFDKNHSRHVVKKLSKENLEEAVLCMTDLAINSLQKIKELEHEIKKNKPEEKHWSQRLSEISGVIEKTLRTLNIFKNFIE